ncbi:MAG: hypothetical protein R2706_21435, partial [Acidimicrobiales bacterium]
TSIALGEPVFVELPQLPVGLHTVHVRARAAAEAEAEALGDLDVVMRIREARPWPAGAAPYGPLLVHVDPLAPTLEQLWDGQVDIEARGPAGRSMRCAVLLFENADGKATVTEALPPLAFPLTPERWRAHFEKHFRELKKAQSHYDTAHLCRLQFTAEELGAFTIECEREFAPLRWALRQPGRGPVARLIDDSGAPDLAEVSHFTFERPTVAVQLLSATEHPVDAPGGLYVARQGDFVAGLIALPRIRTLADLAGTVNIDGTSRSAEAVLEAIKIGELWGSARSSGDILSWSKRQQVLSAIVRHVLQLVGGERWAAAEREAEVGADSDLAALKRAVWQRRDQAGIAAALALEVADLAEVDLDARVTRLAELAGGFLLLAPDGSGQGLTDLWLAEFALRLASSPKDAATWAGPELRLATTRLLEIPTLARAARFLVIATDRRLGSQVRPGEVYAGWSWS